MGLNSLYSLPGYDSEHGHFENVSDGENGVSAPFVFDGGILKASMRRLYEKKYDPLHEIDENLFNEFWNIYNDAADKGLRASDTKLDYADRDADFYRELRYNNGVFAAFKTHRFQNDMASQLIGEDGKLKSFTQWERDTASIRNHHVRRWLETEYNTAVRRAHLAADWRQFEREKDILPNLRWVKTTAVTPGKDHEPFWDIIRPVDDPFWNEHRPGDRWGCKCGLRSTDADPTPLPTGINDPIYKPAPGLNNNPGKDAMLFSFSHPYFIAGYLAYKKLKPIVEKFVGMQMEKRRKSKEFSPDEVAGKKLLIHNRADGRELTDNIRTGRTLIDNFPRMKIRVREHVGIRGVKNPEYEINGFIADAKRVRSEKGITDAFVRAKEQNCDIVVIDFDKYYGGKEISRIDVAKRIAWRKNDFESGSIRECYIVHNGKSIRITKNNYSKREWIEKELKKSGM